jgi:predicted peptidase
MLQQGRKYEKEITLKVSMQYLLHLPTGYGDSDKKWPLILFLHGAGERGNDLELVKRNGIPKIVETIEDFPFIAVSPQCPDTSWWGDEIFTLNLLLDELVEKYNVDEERIYLTGLSMGGYGTWMMAAEYPERFAAIAPVCGGGNPETAQILKELPIWAFHGAKDDIVPIGESESMVNAVKEAEGNVQFTVYPEAGHDSWTETYNNPELYHWFLKHA